MPLDRWGAPDALSNGSFGLGIMSTGVIQQLRGPNVTQFRPPYPTSLECTKMDILHTIFLPFVTWPNVDFPLNPFPPPSLFVHVVIEWPVEGRFRDKDNWIWIRKHKYIKQQPKSKNLSIRGLFITEHASSCFWPNWWLRLHLEPKILRCFIIIRGSSETTLKRAGG